MNRKVVGVLAALVLSVSASLRAEEQAKKELKVGVVLGLSGDAANHSDGIRKGMELAADELRKSGRTVTLDVQDDFTNPGKTVSSIQYLLSRGYRLFIGPTWSFQVNAAKRTIEKSDAVAIAPAGSSDINGGASPAIFNLYPPRMTQVPVVSAWLKSSGRTKAYILTPVGDWGETYRTVSLRAAKDAGVAVVGNEQFTYGADTTAMKSFVTKIRAAGADIILTTGGASEIANLLRAREELRFEGAILSSDNLWDAVTLKLVDRTDSKLKNAYVVTLPFEPRFVDAYRERYGEPPKVYSDKGYDALMLFAEAVDATDGSAAAIRKYFATTESMRGISEPIRFSAEGDVLSGEYRVVSALDGSVWQ